MRAPAHLFGRWQSIRRRARRYSRFALLTDFDGTLVPIRPHPGIVKMPAHLRKLLQRIARSGACVGVISGRALEDVRQRVGVSGIWYAGAHGAYLCDPQGRLITRVTRRHRQAIALAFEWLRPRLASLSGIWMENKTASLAVHYRGASPRVAELAELIVSGALAAHPDLYLMSGKKIWEILPDERMHKGEAVEWILGRESRRRDDLLAFYLGDDATDENVFRRLRGVTVRVGRSAATRARFFLKNPAEVAQLLERWNELENESAREAV